MNFSQALDALNQGEPITNGNPFDIGYLLMYKMVDKSIGKNIIIKHYKGDVKSQVYDPTQSDLLDNNWRILKETEL